MSIIDKILSRKEFESDPPVLIDIGASESLPKEWQQIAKYSICIAFDADERKMGYIVNEDTNYRKLYTYNCIVSDKISRKNSFYLTSFPYCSSLLEPNIPELKNWDHSDLFRVKKKVSLNSITLPTVLNELNIRCVDWFKTDSQGMDLRLFNSLGDHVINKVLVADFEPEIMEAYKGEERLGKALENMTKYPFFASDMRPRGAIRITERVISGNFSTFERKILNLVSKKSPCWAEISYLNTFERAVKFSKRDFLLGWIFSLIKNQTCFALELATKGKEKFHDLIFSELEQYSIDAIKKQIIFSPFYFIKQICPLHR